jgi:hypothetical protein
MAVRDGMATLIERLRPMAAAGTADFTLTGVTGTFWSDQMLQDRLDQHAQHWNRVQLRPEPEYIGGTALYHDYYAPKGNLEEAASGSVYWQVEDGDGDDAGTANYTVDYVRGIIRFTADQSGTAYYLRARAYNLEATAAQIWREKMGYTAALYDFSSDNHKMTRSQWFDHCEKMAKAYDKKGGARIVKMVRGDLN